MYFVLLDIILRGSGGYFIMDFFFGTQVCQWLCVCVCVNNTLLYVLLSTNIKDWCNKGCGMCYPVCGMVHIKEPLLLIGKSSPCGSSGFPLTI